MRFRTHIKRGKSGHSAHRKMKKNYRIHPRILIIALICLLLIPAIVMTASAEATNDLNITTAVYPFPISAVFAKEPNTVRVINVKNNGPETLTNIPIALYASDVSGGTAPVNTTTIASLGPGSSTSLLSLIDPTIRDLEGGTVTYMVVLDPDNLIEETDETNNEKTSTAKPVVYNGYKGKRYWEGGSDITTRLTYDLNGGVVYSTQPSTAYMGVDWTDRTETWNAEDLTIPGSATIEKVLLYLSYNWDQTPGGLPNWTARFNGNTLSGVAPYTDKSNFGSYPDYEYGLYRYDVTSQYSSAGNSLVMTPGSDNKNALYPSTLIIIYRDPTGTRKQIFINEECDELGYSESSYATTMEEATAYAPFTGMTIDTARVQNATMFSFVGSAGPDEGNLFFNGNPVGTNAWQGDSNAAIALVSDVKNYLLATGNEAGIQSTSSGGMVAIQQILVVEYAESAPVVAAFTATPVIGLAPSSVTFTDASTNTPTSWLWESRASGTSGNWTSFSTDQNPTSSFDAGAYDIRLTASNSQGSDTITKTQFLSVSAGPERLTTTRNGTVSGDLYVGVYQTVPYGSQTQYSTNTFDQSFTLPTYTSIQWARLYTVVSASGTDNRTGTATVKFDGNGDITYETTLGTETLATAGTSSADVYPVNDHINRQYSDYMLWYDVTSLISSQNPKAQVVSTPVASDYDARIKEIALVVAFNDGDSDQVHYWVNDGHDYQASGASGQITNFDTDSLVSGWANATLKNVMLSSKDAKYTFNSVTYTGANSTVYFGTNDWDVTSALIAGSDSSFTYIPNGGSYKTTLATLAVKYSDAPHVPVAAFSANKTAGHVPLAVKFTDASTNSPTAWAWDFNNDGTIDSTGQNPEYTYTSEGTYSVNLTVTNAAGTDSELMTDYITVTGSGGGLAPVVAFGADPTSGTAPLTVRFTDVSENTPTSWLWDFGDGDSTNATEQNPVHTFAAAGSYTVNLTATNACGSGSNEITEFISVSSGGTGPVAGFTADRTTGAVPLDVQFTDTSSGSPVSWYWEFGDGNTSTVQNPAHSYTYAGTFTVNLTVTSAEGSDIESKSRYIHVTGDYDLAVAGSVNPVASTLFAREPNTIQIIDIRNTGNTTTPATDVELRSSDGFTGRGTIPALARNAGATVSVTDSTVRATAGGIVSYNITLDPDNTVAELDETNNNVSASFTVTYNGYKGKMYWEGASNVTTKRSWDLNGGIIYSAGDSQYRSGSGSWTNYTVNWSASDLPVPSGAGIREARLYVPYTWDDADIADNTHIDFNSVRVPYEYWYHDTKNFGSYSTVTYGLLAYNVTAQFRKNDQNTALFSRDTGNTGISPYGFTLVIIYDDATATRKQVFLNEEFDLLGADSSNFATSPEEATAYVPFTGQVITPQEIDRATLVTFVPSGNGPEGDLLFNGNVLGTSVWQYDLSGTEVAVDSRDVKDYITSTGNEAGIRSTAGSLPMMAAAHNFLIVEYNTTSHAPVAAFGANPTTGTAPLTVLFTDASENIPTSWLWDFGDGESTNATEQNPVHTYASAGNYTVNLTVSNANGSNSNEITDFITVTGSGSGNAPVAAFSTAVTNGVAPVSATFTDASTNTPTTWNWESRIADNGTWTSFSTDQNPVHSFTTPGTYDIRLTAANADGSDTLTRAHVVAVADADEPLTTVRSGTVSGDLFVESPSTYATGVTEVTHTFTLPADAVGNIQWARLYVNTYSGTAAGDYGLTSTVQLDGNTLGVETMDIKSTTTGASFPLNDHVTKVYSDYEAWYNVTSLITLANPVVHVKGEAITGLTFDGRIKGITLVAAYNDGDADSVHYWVQHGQHYVPSGNTGSTTFDTSSVPTGWTSANASIRYHSSSDASYTFNSVSKSGSTPPNTGGALNSWSVADDLIVGTNTLEFTKSTSYSYKATLATLAVKYQTVPVAVFGANPTSGTVPLTVQFSDASENNPTTWLWNFGDGNTSTAQNPSHTYVKKGNYTVNLTVSNAAGSNSNEIAGFITVISSTLPPTAAFSANRTSGDVPMSVKFTDQSTGSPANWTWDFGDGGSAIVQNPVHTYSTAGNYSVRLTVENDGGSNSTLRSAYIAAIAPTIVQNNFTISGVQTTNGGGTQNVSIDTTLATVTTTGNTVNMTSVGNGWDHLEILMTDTPETGGTTINGTVSTVKAVTDPVTAPITSVGTPVVQIELALEEIPGSAAAITQTLTKDPDATAQSAFVLAASSSGKQIDEIAYTLNVAKTNLANCCDGGIIKNATILMTVSPAWVSAHGGTDHIVIMRRADDGSTQFLTTQFLGSDSSGNYVFSALSPNGLSTFAMASVSTTSSGNNTGNGGESTSGGSGGSSSSGGGSSVSTGKGSSVLDFIVGALSSYSGIQTTYVTDKGTYEITPLTEDLDTMTDIKASWKTEIPEKPDGGGKITTSILKKLPDSMLSDYGTTLGKEGLAVNTVAYSMVISEVGITETKNAHVEMTASREWVSQNGGISQIRILRMDDYGNTEILNTAFSRYDRDNGYIAFKAESPRGLCTFTLLGVKTGSGSPGQLSGSAVNLPVTEEIPRNASEAVPSQQGLNPVWIITGFVIITGGAAIAVVSKISRKDDEIEKD